MPLVRLGNETGKVGNQIRVGTPSGPSSTVRRTIEKIIIHPAFTTTRKDSNIGLFYFSLKSFLRGPNNH